MSKRGLYRFVAVGLSTGALWVALACQGAGITVCLFQRLTGVPCPSCGATRGVVALLHGNFDEAFSLNPLSYVLAGLWLAGISCLAFDGFFSKETAWQLYQYVERVLKKRAVLVVLLAVIAGIWVWNLWRFLAV